MSIGDPAAAGLDGAADLRRAVLGRVVLPGDAGYDDARAVWNGMIDRRPAAIVRVASAQDVIAALRFGRERGLRIAVRGGGHNVAGNGTVDGGLVIDLAALKGVEVDAASRTVRVGPGATLGDVDRATRPHELAVPVGVVSATGVGGLTLGGGVGWLTRRHGLTIDNLLAADVVTVEGERVRASEDENPDLFWGLRGGGGNFGIVTSFEFRAHPLAREVFAGGVFHRRDRWADALSFYGAWCASLPDELTSIVSFIDVPDEWLPAELHGVPLMMIAFAWAGDDHAAAEQAVAPLRAFGPPAHEIIEPTEWLSWQSSLDEAFPRGVRAYWKSLSFDHLDAATTTIIATHSAGRLSPVTGVDVHHMGGAFGRVPEDATAFPNRSAGYWLNIYAVWTDEAEDDAQRRWVRAFWDEMQPHAATGQYVNFLGLEDGADTRQAALRAYGPDKLARLTALKNRYDPGNVLALNHNVPPSAAG
jgi:FAD/FMN-containing dehydrogenase